MGGVIVFPLRVLRPGAHFGETPRARQPSGHLCDRSPFPLFVGLPMNHPSGTRSRKPRSAPVALTRKRRLTRSPRRRAGLPAL
jgi:hypothetical protein